MTQQIINIGAAANDGTGDPLRTAFGKSNTNFTELYRLVPTTLTPASVVFVGPGGELAQNNAQLFWNYTANALGIGTSVVGTANKVRIGGAITGNITQFPVEMNGIVQADVTSTMMSFRSLPGTAAAAFTLGNLRHFQAEQGTIGAGSAVTNQMGLYIHSSMVGAANNYGVYSDLPVAGAQNWNIYAPGTAPNYMNAALGIGTSTPQVKLDVTGAIAATVTVKTGVYTVATLPSAAASTYGRAMVTNSTAPVYGGVVAGGGANYCPVFSNGFGWLIG